MQDDIQIILPYPPSINKYYVKTRNGIFIGKAGKEYREAVAESVMQQGLALNLDVPLLVEIKVFVPDRRKRDLDNVCKALLDALTHANVWIDDSMINQLFIYRGEIVNGGSIVVEIVDAAPLCIK